MTRLDGVRTVFDLMAVTVQALAGKPVLLRYKVPGTKGLDGECHANESGRLIIDIRPYLDDDRLLYVLCHEAAHARLHTFLPSSTHKARSGTLPQNRLGAGVQTRESQADQLAKRWIDYTNSYGGDFQDKLIRLLDYYKRGTL